MLSELPVAKTSSLPTDSADANRRSCRGAGVHDGSEGKTDSRGHDCVSDGLHMAAAIEDSVNPGHKTVIS